jgi:hypothetical protein
LALMAKLGDRIEFGSAVEPCGGRVAYIDGRLAIIAWDGGGETVTSLSELAMMACDNDLQEAGPAEESADVDRHRRPHRLG